MPVYILTDENFQDVITSSEIPVVVKFWAEWCQPCKAMKSWYNEIASNLNGKVLLCSVDTQKEQNIAKSYGVKSLPTILLFEGGDLIFKRSGNMSKEDLLESIAQNTALSA